MGKGNYRFLADCSKWCLKKDSPMQASKWNLAWLLFYCVFLKKKKEEDFSGTILMWLRKGASFLTLLVRKDFLFTAVLAWSPCGKAWTNPGEPVFTLLGPAWTQREGQGTWSIIWEENRSHSTALSICVKCNPLFGSVSIAACLGVRSGYHTQLYRVFITAAVLKKKS